MKGPGRRLALLAACAAGLSCGERPHAFPDAGALRGCARELGLAGRGASGLHVYLDSSASMRGFALAATANRAGAPEGFSSILLAVDSLGELSGRGPLRSASPLTASRFDLGTAGLPAGVSLVQAGLGAPAQDPEQEPAPDRRQTQRWRSADCSGRASGHWGGAPAVRARIDRFFRGAHTCLSRVLDEAAAGAATGTAYVVVTDAEQNAPDDSPQCHSARSPLGIQTRLDEWLRGRGNYAAVAVFRLDSFGWRAPAVGDAFCGAASRSLYVYLLTPDAETAEAIFGQLAGYWRGGPGSLAYFPLAQRPAAEVTVEMKPLRGADGATALIVPAPGDLTDPEPGTLPVLSLKQKGDSARVQLTVRSAVFQNAGLRGRLGLPAGAWADRRFSWREQPLRVAFARGNERRRVGAWRLADQPGGLSFSQPAGVSPATAAGAFQLGHFHAGPRQEVEERAPAGAIPPLILECRRRPGAAHGCEVFLLELESAASPRALAGAGQEAQLVLLQARFLIRRAPVIRFLLHVDY